MSIVKLQSKEQVSGEVYIPSSKSYTQRVLALCSLSDKSILIKNIGDNDDAKAAIGIIKSLGAELIISDNEVEITAGINTNKEDSIKIDCGESGLSTRLFSCFSLLYDNDFIVDGKGSIKERTMNMVIEGLEEFGKEVESQDTMLPLAIKGEVNNTNVKIDGSLSSQFLTGLLLVCPFLKKDTIIYVNDLKSKPYIEMTLGLLDSFGLKYKNKDFKEFHIPGNQRVADVTTYSVEGDWSSASYFIVAGAIGGKIRLKGLNKDSFQGDKELLNLVEKIGAKVTWDDTSLIVESSSLTAFEFDATDCPDLFPALVVLAAYSGGVSVIKGVHRLTHKESNRALTLQEEVAKIGVKVELEGDLMKVNGVGGVFPKKRIVFNSHNDHRIAMAMSLFSINSSANIEISGAESVAKSYPDFFKDLTEI